MSTLQESRAQVMAARHTKEGIICPCCDKYAKVYARSIGIESLRVLVKLYHLQSVPTGPQWVKIGKNGQIKTSGGDYAKMRWWGLIEHREGKREDGSNRAGYWRITPLGRQFAECKKAVPKYVYEYNNEPIVGPSDADNKLVFINEAHAEFDYNEMMGKTS